MSSANPTEVNAEVSYCCITQKRLFCVCMCARHAMKNEHTCVMVEGWPDFGMGKFFIFEKKKFEKSR